MSNKEILGLLIGELEEERLNLFRSAANLDGIIKKIKVHYYEGVSKEHIRDLIIEKANYRHGYTDIYELSDGKVKEIFDKYLKLLE